MFRQGKLEILNFVGDRKVRLVTKKGVPHQMSMYGVPKHAHMLKSS